MLKKACDKNDWTFGNKILYDLCAKYPNHTDKAQVIAKIWLIGRGYAAAIERVKKKRTGVSDFYTEIAAPEIVAADIDRWLRPLKGRKLGRAVIPEVLAVHSRLTDLFSHMTGLNKRSLASKYLHFHFPKLFFIYDSRVQKALRILSPILSRVPNAPSDGHYDNDYRIVFEKCLDLREQMKKKHKITLSPRQVDSLLLGPVLLEIGGRRS